MKIKLNMYIEEADLRKVRKIAEGKGLNVSAYVRMVLKEKIDEHDRNKNK